MSIRIYVNCSEQHLLNISKIVGTIDSEKVYFPVPCKNLREISIPKKVTPLVLLITWESRFFKGDGYSFPLGLYTSRDYRVEVTKSFTTRGNRDYSVYDTGYSVKGSFTSLSTAQAFEHEFIYGEIIPTYPLTPRSNLSAEQYTDMCKDVVSNRVRLDNLEVLLPGLQLKAAVYKDIPTQLSELESRLAQVMNHLTNLEQFQQNKVAVPV